MIDSILTLHEANIDHKCYRLWSKPNKQVEITVRTGAGMTNPVEVEDVTKEEMEDAMETYNLKLTKKEMGNKINYYETKNEEIRKPQTFVEEMNLEEWSIAMRVNYLATGGPGRKVGKPQMRETQGPLEY